MCCIGHGWSVVGHWCVLLCTCERLCELGCEHLCEELSVRSVCVGIECGD